MRNRFYAPALLLAISLSALTSTTFADEWKSGIKWEEPKVVVPGENGSAPSDAIVLFDGKDLSAWNQGENWIIEDGYAISNKSGIESKQKFGDIQLHLEWASPAEVKGTGQGRGNSGVYFMGRYEVQILDSYKNATYFDGQAASIYKQTPPLVNATRGPGKWQTYDIIFNAPKFDDAGKLAQPGFITVLHNGVVVQNQFQMLGGTFWDQPPHYQKHAAKESISLQFHGNPVRFRNIWVRELKPVVGVLPKEEAKTDAVVNKP
ncbi:MAG: hypothetical protein COA78_09820 [Blastopirellula sp.]|nr:MAG: hypothetical protein COA78_09820 [Blastopirellula sp.]